MNLFSSSDQPAAEPGMRSDMSPELFEKFSYIVYQTCGIKLSESKITLLSARVGKRIRQLDVSSYQDYYKLVCEDASGRELGELVNVVTTNVSRFFRLERHYEVVVSHMRERVKVSSAPCKIWCAACAGGEEPYSVAMALRAHFNPVPDVRILATDISSEILVKARRGVYPKKVFSEVPEIYKRYFEHLYGDETVTYSVEPVIKNMVTFSQVNLAYPPFRLSGPFEIIFCSNVMIYFDNEVRRRLLDALFHLLTPGGLLLVGSAEGLTGLAGPFEAVEPSIYRRPGDYCD